MPETQGTKKTGAILRNPEGRGKKDSGGVNGESIRQRPKARFTSHSGKDVLITAGLTGRRDGYLNFNLTPSTGQRARTLMESGKTANRSAGMYGNGLPE